MILLARVRVLCGVKIIQINSSNCRIKGKWMSRRRRINKMWLQTYTRLQVFVTCMIFFYFGLLSFNIYYWKRNIQLTALWKKVAHEKTEHCNLTRKFMYVWKCRLIIISHYVFRRKSAENWSYKDLNSFSGLSGMTL